MTEVTGTSAGGRLRAAREAAGLSVDAVAHQLKLAPRQVTALEEDDWQHLPGRTFVRGFARNYARFVRLDPDAVLSLLPAPDAAPALERPALRASTRRMGEIPVEREAKPSAARFLLPLLVVVAAAAFAWYELSRTAPHLLPGFVPKSVEPPAEPAVRPLASTPSAGTSTLPNPVAAASPGTSTLPNPAAATPAASAGDGSATAASAPAATSAPASGAPASGAPATPAPAADAARAEAPLVLTFRGTSWAEVKDASGHVVLQMTGGAGMAQTVTAMPPLELALGNAPAVSVTFRGQSLDLSPYTRGNVARVSLK